MSFVDTPKVDYESVEVWEGKKKTAYKIIKEGIFKWIVEDEFEYIFMKSMGITIRQSMFITDYIRDALLLLTQNKEWSENVAFEIINGIKSFVESMIKIGIWENTYNELTNVQLANMIYLNIEYQLDDDTHSPCILEEIPQYTCEQCKKKDNYLEKNRCYDCNYPEEI
jgi:hypothetical protein